MTSALVNAFRMPHPPNIAELLAARGFEPESFHLVINTHLHWDHAGGNTVGEEDKVAPAFPNARYVVQAGEVEHARKRLPRDAVSYKPVNYEPLVESGAMTLLDGSQNVAPGVRVQVTPGHNRDMMTVEVRSKGETYCHLSDLVPYAAQVTPTWVSGFDLFPLETIENKSMTLSWCAEHDTWCSFGHDPKVAFAKMRVEAGKWEVRQSQE